MCVPGGPRVVGAGAPASPAGGAAGLAAIIGPPVDPGSGSGPGALVVQTTYNDQGYPASLKRLSDGYVYATVTTMNAYGHATTLLEGNGVTVYRGYDPWTGLQMSTHAVNGANATVAHLTTTWDYTGQESLDAVQLVDYNARLYDPALGRFLSVDPLIAHPGSTQSINPYSYVENNPLNKVDPTGEEETCTLNGSGGTQCVSTSSSTENHTITPAGSLIPQHTTTTTTTTVTTVNGKVTSTTSNTTSTGTGALPGGGVMTSMDGNSSISVTGVVSQNSKGRTNVSDGTTLSNQRQTSPGTNSANSSSKSSSYKSDYQLYLVALSSHGDWPTGHAFIGGITPNGKVEAEGFYSTDMVNSAIGLNVPGQSKSDYKRFIKALKGDKNFALLRADVDKKTYERVMSEMGNYDQSHLYNLYRDNCVTAAETIWYKNGLSQRKFGDWSPDQLYNRIRDYEGLIHNPPIRAFSPIYRQ